MGIYLGSSPFSFDKSYRKSFGTDREIAERYNVTAFYKNADSIYCDLRFFKRKKDRKDYLDTLLTLHNVPYHIKEYRTKENITFEENNAPYSCFVGTLDGVLSGKEKAPVIWFPKENFPISFPNYKKSKFDLFFDGLDNLVKRVDNFADKLQLKLERMV